MFYTQGQISCRMLSFLQQMGNITWILIIEITPDFEKILSLNNDRIGHGITFEFFGTDAFV